MARPDRPCRKLAGRCIESGEHWDHYSRMITVPVPGGSEGPGLFDARLEQYDDGQPLLVLGYGGDTVTLDSEGVAALCGALKMFGCGLLRLACYHAIAVARRC